MLLIDEKEESCFLETRAMEAIKTYINFRLTFG